jgi:uncharacterized protein (DUF2147 family)
MDIRMKKLALLCAVLIAGQFCFALDPAEGFWFSVDEKKGTITAGWELYEQNGLLYGRILSTVGYSPQEPAAKCKRSYPGFPVSGVVNQMPVGGTPWIFGLRKERDGVWANGNVVNPEDGNMYRCKITLHPADGSRYKTEALEMRGEVGLGIGRSQFWQRCTREEALSLR